MIRKLPDDIIRRIAAGEVIDHPSSIVKELVENAIDAKASKIKISIENGGKSTIVIDDNGSGMGAEDLKMAVLPHATSKIENFDDIFSLSTFGFRGEALASIGVISKMKIESSNTEAGTGSEIEVIGGIIGDTYPIAKSRGTKVTVSDLFFNVPARRKFLSSNSVESRMVTEIVEKFILSNNISIEYTREGQSIYRINEGTKLENRIKIIFSEERLISFDDQIGGVRVSGYIGSPDVGRQNRLNEVIFVNGRYVKSPLLMKAIETGYAEHLKKGEFPVAVLFVDVPPQIVDVNVHPQKLEVRFSDQSKIFGMVAGTIKRALASPSVFKIPVDEKQSERSEPAKHEYTPDQSVGQTYPEHSQFNESVFSNFDFNTVQKIERTDEREDLSKTKIIGILKGRYLACEGSTALYLIDIHAVHEKILFDRLKLQKLSSQNLVSPVEIELNEVQKEVLEEHKSEIENFGFKFENDKLISVPSLKNIDDWKELFISTVESFRLSFAQDPKEEFFADVACKMAVKTNEHVSKEEIDQLLLDLDRLEVWSCPHGRPLVYSLDFSRLDRYFGR